MSGILRLESLTKGNTLKQGDKTPLKYRLFDADGEKLSVAGKTAKVRLVYPDFLTIGYEKDGLTVAQDDTVTFTIDGVIPSRIYHVEIIVDGKFIFPSRSDESKFTVDKSSLGTEANIIEIVGVDQIVGKVLDKVDADVGQVVEDINATNEAIKQAEAVRVQAEQERVQGYQEIKQIIADGALNAEPADGSLTTAKFADKAITPDKTSFIYVDQSNLVDPEKFTEGIRFASNGSEVEDVLYTATDFIPVAQGTYIIATPDVSDNAAKVSRVPFYDRDKNFVNIVASGIGASARLVSAEIPYEGYIRIPVIKTYAGNLVVAREDSYDGYHDFMYKSDVRSQPPIASVGRDELINKSVSVDKTDFITIGKNLFNKTEVDLNSFYSQAPLTTTLAGYFTIKEPIELKADTTYTISHVRQWYLLNHDGSVISSNNTSNNNATVTFTTTDSCLLYMSGAMSNLDVTQLEVGDKTTTYEPYAFYFPSLSLTDEQKGDQGESPTPLIKKDINVTKVGETFILSSDLDRKPIVINTERQGRDNNLFNFISTSIDGNTVHNNSDDVAPIRTFTTVGANHGYTTIAVVTMASHGKTQADLGSVWTDGTTEYTLLKVSGNDLTFGCPYSVDGKGVVSSVRIMPSSNLTHVSGATNTQSVDVTNSNAGQLYPSVNNQKVDYVLDGKVITTDGSYSGDTLQVVESYRIMDYKGIIDWSRANIGKPFSSGDIDSVVKIKNTYTFTKGLRASTSHSLTAIKPLSLGRCGFLQSMALSSSGHKTVRTMPAVSVDGFTFDVGQDLTNYNSNLIIEDSNLKDSTIPPAYYTDWLVDSANNRKYGFSMGYIVDKTNSKNSDRLQNTPRYWDLRSTRKSYPIAVEGISLEAGDYLSFSGFRQYLTPESNDVNNFIVRDTRDAYVYADYSEAQTHVEVSSIKDIGKKIEVLQSENYTSVNDTVDASGVVYKTTGAGGAIVKLV